MKKANRQRATPHGSLIGITDVCEKTGIHPVTLRAWERRYGLIQPQRTPKGHRLYSDDDVALIHRITYWLERGVAIGRVSTLLAAGHDVSVPTNGDWQLCIERTLQALEAMDAPKVENILQGLIKQYPLPQVLSCWADAVRDALMMRPVEFGRNAMLACFVSVVVTRLTIQLLNAQRTERRQPYLLVMPWSMRNLLDALMQANVLQARGVRVRWVPSRTTDHDLKFLCGLAGSAGVLVVLAPDATSTGLARVLRAVSNQYDKPVYLSGDGVITLGASRLPVTTLYGDRVAVAEAMSGLSGESGVSA